MKILCAFGEHAYGDRERGKGYEYVNFLPAFKALGHHVDFIDIWDRSRYRNFSELNFAFLKKVEQTEPDVIFFVLMGYELWVETLNIVKESSQAVLINWSTDDSWKYEQFSRFVSPAFDLYVTTYQSAIAKAKRDNLNNFILSQWAANEENLLSPKQANACRYRISFIGAAYGNRRKWVKLLKEHGYSVECFGYGWPHGVVDDADLPEIVNNSVISLNFGDSGLMFRGLIPYRSRQIKARIFEVLGYGGFLATEPADGLEVYYHDKEELVIFRSLDELIEILKKYLVDLQERNKIAENGYHKTVSSHTYSHRFKEILDLAEQRLMGKQSGSHSQEVNLYESRLAFETIAKKHSMSLFLKMFKSMLLIPCIAIWGKEKGMKAGRRIIFEICWRVSGRKTYTAQGLPGRLFYKES